MGDSFFNKKNIIITGGSGKIGKSLVKYFSRYNSKIILPLRKVKEYGEKNIYVFKCDLSSENQLLNFSKNVLKKFKKVDIIINNAALDIDKSFYDVNLDEFTHLLKVNSIAPYLLSKYFSPSMKKNKFGKIINISSILEGRTIKNSLEYSMSKAALNALTRGLAVELGKYNININGVAIGGMRGKMTQVSDKKISERSGEDEDYDDWKVKREKIPLGRRGTFKEFTEVIIFLASEKSNYINGQTISVDGGITILQ